MVEQSQDVFTTQSWNDKVFYELLVKFDVFKYMFNRMKNDCEDFEHKLDGFNFKYNNKCFYNINGDGIFKHCKKCKNFLHLDNFNNHSHFGNCLFQKTISCKECIKNSRTKEKEVQYYKNKQLKKDPNYIPRSERPKVVKPKAEKKNEFIKRMKIEEEIKKPEIAQNLEKIVLENKKQRGKKVKVVEKTFVVEPEVKLAETKPVEIVVPETQNVNCNNQTSSTVKKRVRQSNKCSLQKTE